MTSNSPAEEQLKLLQIYLNWSIKDLNSLGIDGNEISCNVDKVINYI